jgi:hypothetical protein
MACSGTGLFSRRVGVKRKSRGEIKANLFWRGGKGAGEKVNHVVSMFQGFAHSSSQSADHWVIRRSSFR